MAARQKLDLYQLHFGGACELLLQLAIVQSRCVIASGSRRAPPARKHKFDLRKRTYEARGLRSLMHP